MNSTYLHAIWRRVTYTLSTLLAIFIAGALFNVFYIGDDYLDDIRKEYYFLENDNMPCSICIRIGICMLFFIFRQPFSEFSRIQLI